LIAFATSYLSVHSPSGWNANAQRLHHRAHRYPRSGGLRALRRRSDQGAAAHGRKALARGGRYEALEGKARARNGVLEFDSSDAARAEYHSAEYQAARALREGAAEVEIVLVEGA
jgi:uncharacterized protein (DUF1330 family)